MLQRTDLICNSDSLTCVSTLQSPVGTTVYTDDTDVHETSQALQYKAIEKRTHAWWVVNM